MIKFYTFLISAFFLNSIVAQNNDVIVFAEDAVPFYVFVDGMKQNEKAATNVKLSDLNTDRINLKIVFEAEYIDPVSKNVWLGNPDEKFSNMLLKFSLVKAKKGYKLKWFDMVKKETAPEIAAAPTPTPATITPVAKPTATQTVVKETVTTTTTNNVDNVNMNTGISTDPNMNMNMNMNMNANDAGINMNMNENTSQAQPVTPDSQSINLNMNVNFNENTSLNNNVGMNTNMNVSGNNLGNAEAVSNSSTTTTTTTTTTSGMGHANQITAPVQVAAPTPINDCEVQNINSILSAVENESFKSDRMRMAKQATRNKCLSVGQIKQLLEKFSFEDSKLEFAKHAYAKCTNKDDYYMISDSFTFSSSKSELNDFIFNQ